MMDLQITTVAQLFMWSVALVIVLFLTAVVFAGLTLVCYGGAAFVGKLVDVAIDRRRATSYRPRKPTQPPYGPPPAPPPARSFR